MKKSTLALCVLGVSGAFACGSSESDPIYGGVAGTAGASAGSVSTGGKGGGGGGGKGGMTGGSAGVTGGGAPGSGGTLPGDAGSGADAGDPGTSGTGGANPSTGGSSGTGASSGTGGTSGAGGSSGDGGSSGETGDCTPVHPNVNGSERTCNAGFCYCSDNDACFEAGVASSCCTLEVVCEAGAVDPVVTINHPGDGEMRAANSSIPFVGVATDPQDGALSGAALVWTSSILSTPVGTGLSFDASLPPGTHLITLTATDSDSNTGTDSITLIIE